MLYITKTMRLLVISNLLNVCFISTWLTGLYGYLVVKPPDVILTIVGDRTSLQCGTDISRAAVTWYFRWIGGRSRFAIIFDAINLTHSEKYSLSSNGSGRYDLIINHAHWSDAGLYVCRDNNGASEENAEVQVVVTNQSVPTCFYRSSGSHTDVVEGDVVRMECSWIYASNIRPSADWTDTNMNIISSTSAIRDLVLNFTKAFQLETAVELTAGTENLAPLNCRIYFGNSSWRVWTSQEVEVSYGVKKARVNTTRSGSYRRGQTLCCTSEGNPEPMYTWLYLDTGNYTVDRCLTLHDEGEYRCTVSNVVRNVTYTVLSDVITVAVIRSDVELASSLLTVSVICASAAAVLLFSVVFACVARRNCIKKTPIYESTSTSYDKPVHVMDESLTTNDNGSYDDYATIDETERNIIDVAQQSNSNQEETIAQYQHLLHS